MIKGLNKSCFILEEYLELSPVIPKEMSFSHDIRYFPNQRNGFEITVGHVHSLSLSIH